MVFKVEVRGHDEGQEVGRVCFHVLVKVMSMKIPTKIEIQECVCAFFCKKTKNKHKIRK